MDRKDTDSVATLQFSEGILKQLPDAQGQLRQWRGFGLLQCCFKTPHLCNSDLVSPGLAIVVFDSRCLGLCQDGLEVMCQTRFAFLHQKTICKVACRRD